jgi:hypothetical protein
MLIYFCHGLKEPIYSTLFVDVALVYIDETLPYTIPGWFLGNFCDFRLTV